MKQNERLGHGVEGEYHFCEQTSTYGFGGLWDELANHAEMSHIDAYDVLLHSLDSQLSEIMEEAGGNEEIQSFRVISQ